MSEPTVYVIQQPRPRTSDNWTPNLEPATKFGKIEFVFDMGDRIFADPAAALVKARKRLANFDPSKDLLLWPNWGDPASVWLVTMLLARKTTMLRFLYWSKGKGAGGTGLSNETGFYFPVELNVT